MISICQHWRDYPQHFLFNSQESKQTPYRHHMCNEPRYLMNDWKQSNSNGRVLENIKRKVEFIFAGGNKTNRVDSPK